MRAALAPSVGGFGIRRRSERPRRSVGGLLVVGPEGDRTGDGGAGGGATRRGSDHFGFEVERRGGPRRAWGQMHPRGGTSRRGADVPATRARRGGAERVS